MDKPRNLVLWVVVFAIAMGFLESSVVVYLRELYYPEGFDFPLKIMPASIALVELLREAATVIMLLAIGLLAGKTKPLKFAYFILAFAVWDIFYYVFLYLLLGWPQSLATWDILFLIPFPWVGPVWAPSLICVLMTAAAVYIIKHSEDETPFKITVLQWLLMIGGAMVCMIAFMWDYLTQVVFAKQNCWPFLGKDLFADLLTYVPVYFNSPLFFTGFFLMSSALIINIITIQKK